MRAYYTQDDLYCVYYYIYYFNHHNNSIRTESITSPFTEEKTDFERLAQVIQLVSEGTEIQNQDLGDWSAHS